MLRYTGRNPDQVQEIKEIKNHENQKLTPTERNDSYKKKEIHSNIGKGDSSSSQTKCVYCRLSKQKSTDCSKVLVIARG